MDKLTEFKQLVHNTDAIYARLGIKLNIRVQCIRCGQIYEEEDIEKLLIHMRDYHKVDWL